MHSCQWVAGQQHVWMAGCSAQKQRLSLALDWQQLAVLLHPWYQVHPASCQGSRECNRQGAGHKLHQQDRERAQQVTNQAPAAPGPAAVCPAAQCRAGDPQAAAPPPPPAAAEPAPRAGGHLTPQQAAQLGPAEAAAEPAAAGRPGEWHSRTALAVSQSPAGTALRKQRSPSAWPSAGVSATPGDVPGRAAPGAGEAAPRAAAARRALWRVRCCRVRSTATWRGAEGGAGAAARPAASPASRACCSPAMGAWSGDRASARAARQAASTAAACAPGRTAPAPAPPCCCRSAAAAAGIIAACMAPGSAACSTSSASAAVQQGSRAASSWSMRCRSCCSCCSCWLAGGSCCWKYVLALLPPPVPHLCRMPAASSRLSMPAAWSAVGRPVDAAALHVDEGT